MIFQLIVGSFVGFGEDLLRSLLIGFHLTLTTTQTTAESTINRRIYRISPGLPRQQQQQQAK